MTTNSKPNRLAKEKSPYLLQHAYNPVDWFPWSEEAFEIARRENKPIFLSIGYSTCHWCHVMERESFEDEEVAALLNADFISIKVDREERPDIDNLYMSVCQALTGQGGWPLTIVMTPEKKPFFAGAYFPKERKYGRYGLMQLLPQLANKWKEDPAKVAQIGEQIVDETQKRMIANLEGELSEAMLDRAYDLYEQTFDPQYGGFGDAPKFPTSHNLSLLLRYWKRTGNPKALSMVEKTLDAMWRGGMYDHIGFGFARYSTDAEWLVPHFEKMLYDNALLTMTYVEAFQATGNRHYANIAEQIIAYVLRDMTDPEGGFYSAEDADSEGVEGKFYVWTPEEIQAVLGKEEAELFCEVYDITPDGNFEGHSIPNRIERHPVTPEEESRLEASRIKLFEHREKRIHPHKDDKILTSWNGLMIMALAKAAAALQKPAYAEAAARAADFVLTKLRREDGRLLARYRDGEAAYLGYADDYAFMAWGLIELFEATFELKWLRHALELNEEMLRLFWDEENGGLFFYGQDGEQLFTRPKEIYDGAMPSGNSAAALTLQKLARYTFNAALSQKADEQLRAFAGSVERYPSGHALFLIALDLAVTAPAEIVIAGDPKREDTLAMVREVQTTFLPHALTIVYPAGTEAADELTKLVPWVGDKLPLGGRATAYVCENYACQSPVGYLEELRELLGAEAAEEPAD
ncbi:thioredoxin domain-containing protein [Paenibacillus filicis]|uniref:Thioredoxin domain-containing protein n=1 Tax=Paenibacillus gyeongsangnamensis TaxID=3388067 RepID=A0ABT4Q8P8_9BACL|nr:thioredoxin domain-containing protein [Paenibacillus filicis]MCZ8513070.1 thioredoxin domain-containing protein [Paenibacillus filicis]